MGQQATCTAEYKGQRSVGTALLETDELIFRGDFRLRIRYADVRAIEAEGGTLSLRWSDAAATFSLGPLAAKWANRLRSPKGLLEKLGAKPGLRVLVVGNLGADFARDLKKRGCDVTIGRVRQSNDLIFFGASSTDDLGRLRSLQASLKSNGAIWVVRPKGRKDITEAGVMAAGKAAGLVDVKVVRFSDTHTAEKFVVPVARR